MPLNCNWAHILVEKKDCYNKCANCWLCGCEELCAEVAITWKVVSRPDSQSDPIGESEPVSWCETMYWDSLFYFYFYFYFFRV